MRSAARRRRTSVMTCCRGWWAGPGRCWSRGISVTSVPPTPTDEPGRSGPHGPCDDHHSDAFAYRPARRGTDLPGYYREHGGRVLNCALDKYVYVIVKQRFDDEIYVNYSKKEIVSRVE